MARQPKPRQLLSRDAFREGVLARDGGKSRRTGSRGNCQFHLNDQQEAT